MAILSYDLVPPHIDKKGHISGATIPLFFKENIEKEPIGGDLRRKWS